MRRESWLHANIAPILAIIWTIFTLEILRLVLLGEIKVAENITFLIINTLSNICMIIIGYYFGSSAGSKAKQETINKINEPTPGTESISIVESKTPEDEKQNN